MNVKDALRNIHLFQKKETPEKATFVGVGKLAEIIAFCQSNDVDLLIFDSELSPSQQRNLEKLTGVRVIDRTMLILDIFALHAVTGEGKLQVEIACLRYTAPRLTGRGKELSRLGGGIGTALKAAISQGAKRGLFSNESGMGSAPIVSAAAETRSRSKNSPPAWVSRISLR